MINPKVNLNSSKVSVRQWRRKRGKYLLFVRAGAELPLCLSDYKPVEDIQVVLSLYKEPSYTIRDDWLVISGGSSKFDSARLFFESHPEFLEFRYFAFFDPDLVIDIDDIHGLFIEGEATGQYIYQAALDPSSHFSHSFLVVNGDAHWCALSFVEVMAPFFSKKALADVYDGFSESISTWGLEYGWYASGRRSKMSMNQQITMIHNSPIDMKNGPFYHYLKCIGVDPFEDLAKLKSKYIRSPYVECVLPYEWLSYFKPEYLFLRQVLLRVRCLVKRLGCSMCPQKNTDV